MTQAVLGVPRAALIAMMSQRWKGMLFASLVIAQLILVQHVQQSHAGKKKLLFKLLKNKHKIKTVALLLALAKSKLKPKFGILPIPIPMPFE